MKKEEADMYRYLITATLILLLSAGIVYAGCPLMGCGSDKGSASAESAEAMVEPVNTNCPVTGAPVAANTPYTTVYNGEVIGFCCPACLPAFNADPQKYYTNIEKGE